MAAATHEELERLTEKWAGSRLSREDHARMSELRDDDYQRIVVEGGIRRVRRERARHGLDESEARPARSEQAEERKLIEQMKLGMSSLVELLALHDRRREESEKQRLKEAVKEALAETRSGEIVEVHKRGTVNGQEVDVHETHRRRGAGEIEVRKDGTVGGQAVNAVEVHRRGAA